MRGYNKRYILLTTLLYICMLKSIYVSFFDIDHTLYGSSFCLSEQECENNVFSAFLKTANRPTSIFLCFHMFPNVCIGLHSVHLCLYRFLYVSLNVSYVPVPFYMLLHFCIFRHMFLFVPIFKYIYIYISLSLSLIYFSFFYIYSVFYIVQYVA